MRYLIIVVLLTSCAPQYVASPKDPISNEEWRERQEQSRKDSYILTLLAAIPAAVLAGVAVSNKD
jgi:hypothetical protein